MKWWKRLGKAILVLVVVLVAAIGLFALATRHPMPEGFVAGPEADELAHAIERATHADGWSRTAAIRFTFPGGTEHLWDRWRGYDRVRFGGAEVLLDVNKNEGRAWKGGVEVTAPDERRALTDYAFRRWTNDTFWIAANSKLFDGGVVRSATKLPDGRRALLVHYTSGGQTTGDRYLWIVDGEGRPVAWRTWVSVIPIGGFETSWEDWTPLSTGALVSVTHRMPIGTMRMGDVAGAATLAELESPDPFAPIARP